MPELKHCAENSRQDSHSSGLFDHACLTVASKSPNGTRRKAAAKALLGQIRFAMVNRMVVEHNPAAAGDENDRLLGDIRKSQLGVVITANLLLKADLALRGLLHILDQRPSMQELEAQGVLPKAPVDSSLAATRQLGKVMKSDKISRSLQGRSSLQALEHKGVVQDASSKVSPAIQQIAKQLEHQKKADGIKAMLDACLDIDEMLDSGFMVADPRKVAATLAETHRGFADELAYRADPEYLQRINVLKHGNMVHLPTLSALALFISLANLRLLRMQPFNRGRTSSKRAWRGATPSRPLRTAEWRPRWRPMTSSWSTR